MIAGAMVIGGLTLIAAAVAFFAWLDRDLPERRREHALTLPEPSPAVQDAVDTGDAFDRAVDEALAIAKAGREGNPCAGLVWCGPCEAPFAATTIRDVASHLRDIHGPAADHWAAWESELRQDAP